MALTEKQINDIFKYEPLGGATIGSWFKNYAEQDVNRIFQAVQKGVQGESLSVSNVIKDVFGISRTNRDGSVVEASKKDLKMLARTVTLAAANHAKLETYKTIMRDGSGDVTAVEWSAVFDKKTCQVCAVLNGKRWTVDELDHVQTPPAHPNCRCVILPHNAAVDDENETQIALAEDFDLMAKEEYEAKTGKSWDKLADSTKEKKMYETRAAWSERTGQKAFITLKNATFEDYLRGRSEKFQREWLGPKRYELWKEGKLTLDQMVSPDGRYRRTLKDLKEGIGEEKTTTTETEKLTAAELKAKLETKKAEVAQLEKEIEKIEPEKAVPVKIETAEETEKRLRDEVKAEFAAEREKRDAEREERTKKFNAEKEALEERIQLQKLENKKLKQESEKEIEKLRKELDDIKLAELKRQQAAVIRIEQLETKDAVESHYDVQAYLNKAGDADYRKLSNDVDRLARDLAIKTEGGASQKEVTEIRIELNQLQERKNALERDLIHQFIAPHSGDKTKELSDLSQIITYKKGKLLTAEDALANAKDGSRFVGRLLDSHDIDVQGQLPKFISKEQRAEYNSKNNTLDIGRRFSTDGSLTAHELGHWIETHNAAIKNRCIEWYNEITRDGEVRSLKSDFPDHGYEKYEQYKTSKISMPQYALKVGSGYTEIFSKGMELMYADPYTFSRDYPEYFDFILNTLKQAGIK